MATPSSRRSQRREMGDVGWAVIALSAWYPTAVGGFGSREDVKRRYAEASGRDLDQIDYYVAFGYWKLACIVEGVYARYAGGAMGGDGEGAEAFAFQVDVLAGAAAEAVERL